MEELRPEYVEALNAAKWGWLWCATLAVPFLLLIPAAAKRKFGCLAFPTAYFLTWLVFNIHIQNYWAAKKANAVTDAEWADVTADTGRVFAGVTTIPYVLVYVSVVGAVIYGIVAMCRLFSKLKS